ncbi:uncharacterized protein [Amphiura filiformis]|uniref:uncharacterized protein n=1 Tax=Amphiura filiformis TaxID=82378 RepID=UPI003B21BE44
MERKRASPDWVQCDRCQKWRKLPTNTNMAVVNSIKQWFCEMNPDPYHSHCSIEQELEDTDDARPSNSKTPSKRKHIEQEPEDTDDARSLNSKTPSKRKQQSETAEEAQRSEEAYDDKDDNDVQPAEPEPIPNKMTKVRGWQVCDRSQALKRSMPQPVTPAKRPRNEPAPSTPNHPSMLISSLATPLVNPQSPSQSASRAPKMATPKLALSAATPVRKPQSPLQTQSPDRTPEPATPKKGLIRFKLKADFTKKNKLDKETQVVEDDLTFHDDDVQSTSQASSSLRTKEELAKKAKKSEEDLAQFKEKYQELVKKQEVMEKEMKEVKQELKVKVKEIKQHKEKQQVITSKLAAAQQEASDVQSKLEGSEKKASDLNQTIQSLRQQLNQAQKQANSQDVLEGLRVNVLSLLRTLIDQNDIDLDDFVKDPRSAEVDDILRKTIDDNSQAEVDSM